MIEYRKLSHEDYPDIADLCKDIWNGTDYLPELFHKWVDDKGLFVGAVDTDTNKVIGTDKYSVLYDGTGWLEGLRTHKDYRGRGIGRELALKAFEKARKDLQAGLIDKIAFSTHISSVESITMMKQLGFRLEQEHIFIQKDYSAADKTLDINSFSIESWSPSYEEFISLDYLKRRNDLLPFVFYFQKPTPELYSELLEEGCFLSINGHRGLFKLKGEPHFTVFDESLEGINAFMNYYLLLLAGKCASPPMTSVLPEDTALIDSLKACGYGALEPWVPDYLYFTYR
ncbi:MAG TPA: GNAT family N-acetyltransferase [Clostridia bacterium]|nr:GNAT family N-acetyltransferase [Clostridia bacterium]